MFLKAKQASASKTLKESRKSTKAPPSPVCLHRWRRHLEIWRRQERKRHVFRIAVASRYCCGTSSGLPPLLSGATECCREMLVYFHVISTASLWDLRLWRQWGEGMWEYVRIEPADSNVVRHCAHCNALFFNVFLRCLRPVKKQRHMADNFWQHYWPTRPDAMKTGDADQSFDSGWSLVFIKLFNLYNVLR